jgi:hypothetical protein
MSIYLVVGRSTGRADGDLAMAARSSLQELPYTSAAHLAEAVGPPRAVDRTIGFASRRATLAQLVQDAIDHDRSVVIVPISESSADPATMRLGGDAHELGRLLAPLLAARSDARVAVAHAKANPPPTLAELIEALGTAATDEEQLLDVTVQRAFDGNADRFGRFVEALQQGVPDDTTLAIRGSAVVGHAYRSGDPFDAQGRRTSDLDVVLIGDEAMDAWDPAAVFLPGINTMPLADESPWFAPTLEPCRIAAQEIAGRPVSLQAMARWFLDLRSALQGQPYVLINA